MKKRLPTPFLYLDCIGGISGDMMIGALLDLGLPLARLEGELRKIPLGGYTLRVRRERRHHIIGKRFRVVVGDEPHPHRAYREIVALVRGSRLDHQVKEKGLAIFERLARAEARVHRCPLEKVTFHEVGGIDSIVDVIGTAVGLDHFGFERIVSSSLPHGSGFVETSHGRMPVPAPATLEILKGMPLRQVPVPHEMTTPTGAAIAVTVAEAFGPMPFRRIDRVGYGLGEADFSEVPNVLRILVGEGRARGLSGGRSRALKF